MRCKHQLRGGVVRFLQRDAAALTRGAERLGLSDAEAARLLSHALVRHRAQCRSDKRPRYSAARLLQIVTSRPGVVVLDLLHPPTAATHGIDAAAVPTGPWRFEVAADWISDDALTSEELAAARNGGACELSRRDRARLETLCGELHADASQAEGPSPQQAARVSSLGPTKLEARYADACARGGVETLEIAEADEMIQIVGGEALGRPLVGLVLEAVSCWPAAERHVAEEIITDDAGFYSLGHFVQVAFLPLAQAVADDTEHLDRHCPICLNKFVDLYRESIPFAIAYNCRHWHCLECAKMLLMQRHGCGHCKCPVLTWTVERLAPPPL
ncbi:hypothetical protein EMIHUDRAFT_459177 [Emiliania huxleyi CCMP1516]|uniref:RING-type domain-containing protein n=2 Tax=Emiliania huxleyi TaxID=2903 RepID=A0A0D3IYU8_EMIH1|nr:hypothetical protein EMIHUDRAFT_459177 [Emiliania huxleyi CCMP1516]EOD16433.1 hypothetical protein EMIHUDRAFT_459177 [Emiliania huxleyi CCMP1516]|eukprot:XP_005768862.1 hypothetical protein EMIHUDRAFT_459177 [Emiliania huxleyi CCMP1516]